MTKLNEIEKKLKEYDDVFTNGEDINDAVVDKMVKELDEVLDLLESNMMDELADLGEDINDNNNEDYE